MQWKNIRKKAHEGSEKRHVKFMVYWKNSRDEKVRYNNDRGVEMPRKDHLNGCHIMIQCKPSEKNKETMKELERKIEETYEKFQTKIKEALECAKDVDSSKLVEKIYLELLDEHLVVKNSWTVTKTWHDLRLSTNVKQMGESYPGNILCKCYKWQDGIGVKNVKKALVDQGFQEPTNKTFAYMRQQGLVKGY